MKYQIKYSQSSLDDLNTIFDFIILESYSKGVAERIINDIFKSINMIADYPEIGKELILHNAKTKYRYLVSNKYMIFYSINESNIIINRVIHSRRDYINILFNQ